MKKLAGNHHKRITKTDIPAWMFVALYDHGLSLEEIDSVAKKLVSGLKRQAEFHCWPKEIIAKVLHVNEFDSLTMYSRP